MRKRSGACGGCPVPQADVIVHGDVLCWLTDTDGRHLTSVAVQTDLRFGRRMITTYTPERGLIVLDAAGAQELAETLIKAADTLAERRLPGV